MTSYAWIDRAAGVAQIPVDRAIEIVAERGLPVPPPLPAPRGRPARAGRRPGSREVIDRDARRSDPSRLSSPLSAAPARRAADGAVPRPARSGGTSTWAAQLPLDATFRDESGKAVRLGDYFGKRPVILSLDYYECPMLCGIALEGLARSLKGFTLSPGADFEVVTISFNPLETADARPREEDEPRRVLRPEGRGRGRLALPDGRRGADPPRHRGGRLPVPLGRAAEAVRPRDGGRPRHARGSRLPLLLRRRVRVEGAPPRPLGGLGGQGRRRHRAAPPPLLPVRPGAREVHRDDHDRPPHRRRRPASSASAPSSP